MTKELQLTQGKVALVDDDDYENAMKHKWQAERDRSGNYYAKRRLPYYSTRSQSLAAFVLGVGRGVIVDHIDHNTLNDQRNNLRVATAAQNQQNANKQSRPCSSIYKGVSWHKRRGKWIASIKSGKVIYLGYFDDERDAALAYDKKARELFGEFARCNFEGIES